MNTTLVLKVSDISPFFHEEDYLINTEGPSGCIFIVTNNSIGKIDRAKTDVTWYNINFETLLGDLYNKYEYFKINMVSFESVRYSAHTIENASSVNPFNNTANPSYRNLSIYLHGLDFYNSNYSVNSGNHLTYCHIGNVCEELDENYSKDVRVGYFNQEDIVLYNSNNWYSSGHIFKKQKFANLRITIGAMSGGLDYTPNEPNIFFRRKDQMTHYVVKFNIVPVEFN